MKPFPYQEAGARWLFRRRKALLADEMGLGKTLQALMAFEAAGFATAIIVCPASAIGVWEYHIRECCTYSYDICTVRKSADLRFNADVIVLSFAMVRRLDLNQFSTFNCFIVDECHRLKNIAASQTKACIDLARKAHAVWWLSGTPAPNHPGELWTVLRLFGVTNRNYQNFLQHYTEGYTHKDYGYVPKRGKNLDELKALLNQIMLRRTKEDVGMELPPLFIQLTQVEKQEPDFETWFGATKPTVMRIREVNALYDRLLADVTNRPVDEAVTLLKNFAEKEGFRPRGQSNLPKLRHVLGGMKVFALCERAREILDADPTAKVIIFGHYLKHLLAIKDNLFDFNPRYVVGKTPDRDKLVEEFQTRKIHRVFIGQMQTCAEAITLTAAQHILILDASFVPAINLQAIMRAHRIGQTRTVFVEFIVTDDPLDRAVHRSIARKVRDLARLELADKNL